MKFYADTPEGFAQFLADGVERAPGLYAGKGSKTGSFELDGERAGKVTSPQIPGNVGGLAGVPAVRTEQKGQETAKKAVFDAQERAAGAENEDFEVWDAQEEPPQEEDPNG